MKKNLLVAVLLTVSMDAAYSQHTTGNVQYVDPTIGGVGQLLEPTRPTTHLPNSVIRMYPVRRDQLDDQISYFPLTMHSHRNGNVFALMPVAGIPNAQSWNQRFTYDAETTTPYYYAVKLEDSRTAIEFTPAQHSGYYRFTFPAGAAWLRLHVINREGEMELQGKRIITGREKFNGMEAFVYAELNVDADSSRYRSTDSKKQLLICMAAGSSVVHLRYSISFISLEQAKQNLQHEIPAWNFEAVKNQALAGGGKCWGRFRCRAEAANRKKLFTRPCTVRTSAW